jgi:hypothetical protein
MKDRVCKKSTLPVHDSRHKQNHNKDDLTPIHRNQFEDKKEYHEFPSQKMETQLVELCAQM